MVKKLANSRRTAIGDRELANQQRLAKAEQRLRNRAHVEQGILSDEKFKQLAREIHTQGFTDVMKTTLGTGYSPQGLLRSLTFEDLVAFDRKIQQLEGKYQGGITAEQVINASLAVDRTRASREIPWAHPVASRFLAAKGALVVTFTTAASGKYGATKHYVNVEFPQFKQITTHRLMLEPSKEQAEADAKNLAHSLVKFDCDCGRHTYWYRYIASKGQFAYLGANPLGRAETGFPKIRNPNLKGIACKHVLRTMQTLLNNRACHAFLTKAIFKQFSASGKKDVKTQTTRRDMERNIQQMHRERIAILSSGEKFLAPKLLERYRQHLSHPTRNAKDRKTPAQKIAVLAKSQDVEALLPLVK